MTSNAMTLKQGGRLLVLYVGLIVIVLLILGPILWLAINSLKTNVDAL